MKGSAITGPVAKECVSTWLSFFRPPILMSRTRTRILGGLVATYCIKRGHSGLGLWISLRSVSLSPQIVMPCISKCQYACMPT